MPDLSYPQRPSIPEIAFRCLCLRAEWMRGRIDWEAKMNPSPQNNLTSEAKLAELKQWVAQEEIYPHMSQAEQTRLNMKLGQLSDSDMVYCRYTMEALGTIAWGGELEAEMPPYDQLFNAIDPVETNPIWLSIRGLLTFVGQRSYSAIAHEIAKTMFCLYRLTYLDHFRGQMMDEEAYRKQVASKMERDQDLIHQFAVANGDILYKGRPFDSITPDEQLTWEHVLYRRLVALYWLAGDYPDWDEPLEIMLIAPYDKGVQRII